MRLKLPVVMLKLENNWHECSNCDKIEITNLKGLCDVTHCYRKTKCL